MRSLNIYEYTGMLVKETRTLEPIHKSEGCFQTFRLALYDDQAADGLIGKGRQLLALQTGDHPLNEVDQVRWYLNGPPY